MGKGPMRDPRRVDAYDSYDWEEDDNEAMMKEMNWEPADQGDNPSHFYGGLNGPKQEMSFVKLKGTKYKSDAQKIGNRWLKTLKKAGFTRIRVNAHEKDQILVSSMGGKKVCLAIHDFILSQPETRLLDWENNKFKPNKKKQEETAILLAKQAKAARKKSKERRKKRREEKRKAQEAAMRGDSVYEEEGEEETPKTREEL